MIPRRNTLALVQGTTAGTHDTPPRLFHPGALNQLVPRQAPPNCDTNYAVPDGTPCVPGPGDYNCNQLARWGVAHITVVGVDDHFLDNDGDGVACESGVPLRATNFGEWVADHAWVGVALTVAALVTLSVLLLRWATRLYRRAKPDDQPALVFGVAGTLIAAFPLAVLGALLFAIIGLK